MNCLKKVHDAYIHPLKIKVTKVIFRLTLLMTFDLTLNNNNNIKQPPPLLLSSMNIAVPLQR